jgi:hypothetical protein
VENCGKECVFSKKSEWGEKKLCFPRSYIILQTLVIYSLQLK